MRTEDLAEDERLDATPGIVTVLGDLARSGLDLAHNTVQLAACESRRVVRLLAIRVGLFFASLVVAVTGVLLLMGAIALLLVEAAGLPAWAAFALVGVVTLAGGALLALRMVKRLGDPDLAFPKTLEQVRTDFATLRGLSAPPRGDAA